MYLKSKLMFLLVSILTVILPEAVVVPTKTFPELSIRIRSVSFVRNVIGAFSL